VSKKKLVISLISNIHYIKLGFRSLLFLAAVATYIADKLWNTGGFLDIGSRHSYVFLIIWTIFVIEIALRFFPSSLESMGCQKQFARNFKKRETPLSDVIVHKPYSEIAMAGITLLAAAIVGVLYYTKVIDSEIVFIICLLFSVVDMVCILFFCPFQEWVMKNRCCVTCPIYNWDYPMMFLPLIFLRNFYTWSLLALSLLLVIKWEVIKKKYPERFMEQHNCSLSCENCKEKLCHHKKSLKRFLKTLRFHVKTNK